MLDAIEEVHDRGFIHRDVKAVIIFSLFILIFSRILFFLKIITTFILWILVLQKNILMNKKIQFLKEKRLTLEVLSPSLL
jgi:hypothetical protein